MKLTGVKEPQGMAAGSTRLMGTEDQREMVADLMKLMGVESQREMAAARIMTGLKPMVNPATWVESAWEEHMLGEREKMKMGTQPVPMRGQKHSHCQNAALALSPGPSSRPLAQQVE